MKNYKMIGILLASTVVSQVSLANLYNVQFYPIYNSPEQMTGAAILGAAGDFWNSCNNVSNSDFTIDDSSKTDTGVTISWSAKGNAEVSKDQTGFHGTPYEALMRGYLYAKSNAYTIKVDGLAPSTNYTVVVYCQGDKDADGRQVNLALNGGSPLTTGAASATDSTFILNKNYVSLEGSTDASGSLSVEYSTAAGEADINGLQIQAVPEPATALLFGIGGFGAWLIRRNKNKLKSSEE